MWDRKSHIPPIKINYLLVLSELCGIERNLKQYMYPNHCIVPVLSELCGIESLDFCQYGGIIDMVLSELCGIERPV